MSEFRALGTIIEFDTATDIGITLTFTGTGSATINSTTLAYYQVAANTKWRFPDLCQYLAKRIEEWIIAAVAIAGDPAGTPNATINIGFTPSLTLNGSLASISMTCTGLTVGGTGATLTAATLANTSGLWSKLGLVAEGSSTRNFSVAGGTASLTGLFQPRSMFVFLRSEVDLGQSHEVLQQRSLRLNDGTGAFFHSGRILTKRVLSLIDLDEEVAGRDMVVARLSSINADRKTLETNYTTESTYNSGGITGASYQGDLADDLTSDVAYVSVGDAWISRVSGNDDSTTPQIIVLYEKVPSSITPPTGCTINRISEVYALWFEAVRTGYLIVYDMIETPGSDFGKVRYMSQEYMLAEESKVWAPDRRDNGAPIYSYTFNLIKRDANDLSFNT